MFKKVQIDDDGARGRILLLLGTINICTELYGDPSNSSQEILLKNKSQPQTVKSGDSQVCELYLVGKILL